MKSPIDKEKAKKQNLKIYAIVGSIFYIYLFDAYLQAKNIMAESRRISFTEAFSQGLTQVLTKPLGFLPAKMADVGNFLLFSIMAAMLFMMYASTAKLRKHDNPETVNGEAHLMTMDELKEYNKRFVDPFGSVDITGKGNMILTQDVRLAIDNRGTRRNCNILTIGGSGAGKSRFFVGPNLLQANCNYVVTDPSGELLNDYGKYLEDQGYDVKVFNLTDVHSSSRYNPFEYIREEKDVFTLVEAFIRNTTPDGKSGGDPFWENSEKLLLTALILYLWHNAENPEDRTFAKVAQMVTLAEVDENDASAQSPLDALFDDLEKEDPENLAVQQYKKFKIGAGKTLKSILISVNVRMQAFGLSDIQYLTGADDFDLFSLGDTKKAIFVVIPTADKTFNFLVAMFYSQIFSTLYSYCEVNSKYGWRLSVGKDNIAVFHAKDEKDSENAKRYAGLLAKDISRGCTIRHNEKKNVYEIVTKKNGNLIAWRGTQEAAKQFIASLKNMKIEPYGGRRLFNHVRFMLDEFANIGQIPAFNEKLATMRKYEISCSIILQALSQLKSLYEKDWNTIVGNCDSVLFLGSADMETIKWIIEKLAKKTTTVENTSWGSGKSGGNTSYNKSSIELLTADQIQMMDDTEALVCIRGVRPFYGKKYELTKHPRYKESEATQGKIYIPKLGSQNEDDALPLYLRNKHKKENQTPISIGNAQNEPVSQGPKPEIDKNSKENSKIFAQKNDDDAIMPDFDFLNNDAEHLKKVRNDQNTARKTASQLAKDALDTFDDANQNNVETFGEDIMKTLGLAPGASDTQIKEAIETMVNLAIGEENDEFSYVEA